MEEELNDYEYAVLQHVGDPKGGYGVEAGAALWATVERLYGNDYLERTGQPAVDRALIYKLSPKGREALDARHTPAG